MPSRKLIRRALEESDDEVADKPTTLAEQLNDKANQDNAPNKSGANSDADPNSQEEQPTRRLRKIKRRLQTYDEDAEDESVQGQKQKSEKDSDGDFSLQEKVERMTKRINNRGKLGKIPKKDKKQTDDFKLDGYSDSDSQGDEKEIKPKKQKKQRESTKEQGRKKRAPAPKAELNSKNINFVKSTNKLIGEIENNELYASDDDLLNDGFGAQGGRDAAFDQDRREELDFGGSKQEAPKTGLFLKKMQTKKQDQEGNLGAGQSVVNIGFVQTLAENVSANQLAASGIQLSMRENIINFIQNMDKANVTQKEQKLLSALQNSQQDTKPDQVEFEPSKEIVNLDTNEKQESKTSNEKESEGEQINSSSIPEKAITQMPSSAEAAVENQESESDEEAGLIFYDPKEEARLQRENKLLEMQKNRAAGFLKDGAAAKGAASGGIAQSSLQAVKQVNQRTNFLAQLKAKKNQLNTVTIDRVKATFQSTELNEAKVAKKQNDDDLLGDRESDSDFEENQFDEDENQKPGEIWDDEENCVSVQEQDDENIGSQVEDENENKEIQEKSKSVSHVSGASSVKDDDEPKRLFVHKGHRRTGEGSNSQTSFDLEAKRKALKRQQRRQKQRMAGFFDEEAGLGSDDEEKDDIVKQINKNDAEENEEGLDDDLDGFVVKADDEVIGEADEEAHQKFLMDLENDEKLAMRQAMEAAIFGNKKRKRGDVEGLDGDEDGFNKRIQERRQEREGMNSDDDAEMQKQLLEGGKGRALEHMKMKQLIEEEELSDDEIKQQMEQSKYFAFLREKRHADALKKLESKDKEDEEEFGDFMVDLNQEAKLKRNNTVQSFKKQIVIPSEKDTNNSSNTTSKQSVQTTTKAQPVAGSGGLTGMARAARINQKKVQMQQPIQDENGKKKSNIAQVATGMQKFMKTQNVEMKEVKANLKASNKANVPMIFKMRKAQIK